jgi:NAD(P)-dependent dehydrogenase (short-subunit alcohol dehydrogenase family)
MDALTHILASELRGSGILVNSVCPGWMQSEMGGSGTSSTIEENSGNPAWTATLPNNRPTGGFFRDRQ